jgi:hypothetical protein
MFNGIGGINKNRSKVIHVQQKFQWAKKVWKHSILIRRITQIYECRLKIDMVGENFLLDLHKMQDAISKDATISSVKTIF